MQSLRVKLIAPFLLGTLTLTLLLAWYTYSSARKAVEDAMLLMSEAKTSHAASSMSLLFKSMTTTVQNMVVDPHVLAVFTENDGQSARAGAAEWLEIITQGNEYYRDIFIVDGKGVCVASSNPGHVGNSFISKAYVQNALKGIFNLGEPAVGRVTKRFNAVIAGPVDAGGRVVGALVLMNDFPKIVDYESKASHDDQTIFTAMLTPEGLWTAHKDMELMGNNKRLFPELYRQLVSVGEQGGVIHYSLNHSTYVGYAKVDPTSKWLVLTSGIEDEVFAPAYRVGFTVLGISFVILCCITLVVVRVSNGILQSLFSLINYAKHVSEGDFELKLRDTERKDELGVLHVSLQRLVQALQTMLIETQQASQMKGQFLANMSHEIRTPLNAIIGMTHLSLRDPNIPVKQRDYLEKIQVAARSLLGLINDILDLSKVEAGMLELEDTPFSLRETLSNVITIHQDAADAKGVGLELVYDETVPEFFIGDPLRIGQVLNNLVSNAMKFTRRGRVTLRCGLAETDGTENGGEMRDGYAFMRVSVTDTGIGIPEEKIAALFQPFTQADASTSRQYGGTGLGLAISDRIVHLLDGEFAVTSTIGEGTTFSFTMRLLVDDSGAARAEEGSLDDAFEQLQLGGKRILVAEDNAINQVIMQELLAPSGATVIMVDNGLQAVEAAKTQALDLIFMDMQMPVMDGLEATRKIREFAGLGDLPIIAVTANAMKEDKARGFESGMNDYITKPIEPQHLLAMLRIWLKHQSAPEAAPWRGRGASDGSA